MPTIRYYRVRITREASSRLEEIFEHIEPDSPQNAALVLERLLDAIEGLSTLPYRYKVHQKSKKLDLVVRSMLVPP